MTVLHKSNILTRFRADSKFHYATADRSVPNIIKQIANPSLVAATLFRSAGSTSGMAHVVVRWACLTLFSSDVASGASFEGAVDLPHPTGIVIGRGARLGSDVRIFQNVTLGSSRKGTYPRIKSGATLFAGAVVVGDVVVGEGAVVGANVLITKSVADGAVIRGAWV